MNRDLICVANTIVETAESAEQARTLSELLTDLIVLFAGAMRVTLRELNHNVLTPDGSCCPWF